MHGACVLSAGAPSLWFACNFSWSATQRQLVTHNYSYAHYEGSARANAARHATGNAAKERPQVNATAICQDMF